MVSHYDLCTVGVAESGQVCVEPDGPVIPAAAVARSGLLAPLSLSHEETVQLPISKRHLLAWLSTVDEGTRRCVSVPNLLLALEVSPVAIIFPPCSIGVHKETGTLHA